MALKGVNEDELHRLVAWCGERGFDLSFIEVMPMGDLGNEDRLDQYWSLRDLRAELDARWTLTDTTERTGGPARYARVAETGGRIGFITPLTHNFCESCNRVRLTCTGQLYMCLGQNDDADLRAVLRSPPGRRRRRSTRRSAPRSPASPRATPSTTPAAPSRARSPAT